VTAEAATLQPQAPSTGEIVTTGMQLELEIAQHSIDQFRVEIEKKFAIATACIVFVLLGAPIALRFPRGGVGLTIGVSLGVFGIYYVGLLGGEALADRALVDPGIAMWATNLLLGAIGVVLTARLGSEGSTSRGSETSEWWGRFMERFRRRKTA
jgi:lipopolysaccharide export system permease protein